MTSPDTITPDETFDPSDPASLAGMLGPLAGLIPPDLLGMLAGAVPDEDATTLDDVADSLDTLHSKLDWLAGVLSAVNEALPNRLRVDVSGYPDD